MAYRYITIDLGDKGTEVIPTRETLINKLQELKDSQIAITVDQDYNPDSKNPQSGKAVSEAIKNKANKGTKLADYGITDGICCRDTLLLKCGDSKSC